MALQNFGAARGAGYKRGMANHRERIAEIREILRTGASSVTSDGTSVSYDFESLRKELRDLMAEDDNQRGKRPVASSIYLGGL